MGYGGTRFTGNGYKRGDKNKFSFGFESPSQVQVMTREAKKVTASDVKQVMFQGGQESAPVAIAGGWR